MSKTILFQFVGTASLELMESELAKLIETKNYHNWLQQSKLNFPYLGKILLINGPESSGKSTLVFKLIENFSNCAILNRQKIVSDIENQEEFFLPFFQKASLISGQKTNSFSALESIKIDSLTIQEQAELQITKSACYNYDQEVQERFLIAIFTEYYKQIKQYIFSGVNIILDESWVKSDSDYEIFKKCLGENDSGIKRVLIYNRMEEILHKCNIRNDKFKSIISDCGTVGKAIEIMEDKELQEGHSNMSYRFPSKIIESYLKFYKFQSPMILDSTHHIDEITKESMETVLLKIKEADLDMFNTFGKLPDTSNIDVKSILSEIFSNNEQTRIIPQFFFDDIIYASKITDIHKLNDPKFLEELLGNDIACWLNISTTGELPLLCEDDN